MRWILSFVLIITVASLSWSIFGVGTPEVRPVPVPGEPSTAVVDESTPVQTEGASGVGADAGTKGVQREALETARGRHVEVRVVHAETADPVSGAEVASVGSSSEAFWSRLSEADRRSIGLGDFEFFRRIGHVWRTDESGLCSVPVAVWGGQVFAETSTHFGRARIPATGEEPFLVELSPDHDLRVRVVDAQAEPVARAEVFLEGGGATPRMLGETEADGELYLRHAQIHFGKEASRGSVVAMGAGVRTQAVEVDLASARVVDVALSFPPTGTLTVEVVDEDSMPYDFEGLGLPIVELTMHASNPSIGEIRRAQAVHRELGSDRRVRFEKVGLNKTYALRLLRYVRAPFIGSGPTSQQPDAFVSLTIPKSIVILSGRILDSDGVPLSSQEVVIGFSKPSSSGSKTARTDEHGVFALPCLFFVVGEEIKLQVKHRAPGRRGLQYRFPGPVRIRAGRNDLGEIPLALLPLVLSGRLVSGDSLAEIQRIGWNVQRLEGERWRLEYGLFETSWHDARHFEVFGQHGPGEKLRLEFSNHGEHLPLAPMEFVAGREGVEIELIQSGRVTLEFLSDVEPGLMGFSATLVQEESEGHVDWSRGWGGLGLQARGKGRYSVTWSGRQYGKYHLRVELPGVEAPLITIPNIVVGSGACEDPRLRGVDLRGKLRSVTLTFVDAEGEPLAGQDVLVIAKGVAGDQKRGMWTHNGRLEFVSALGADYRVVATGFEDLELSDLRGDRIVQMERSELLRVRVQWPFELPELCSPRVRLWSTSGSMEEESTFVTRGRPQSQDRLGYVERECDAQGRAEISLGHPGRYRVTLSLKPQTSRGAFTTITPKEIEWTGESGEEIVLEVDEGKLREALARLR